MHITYCPHQYSHYCVHLIVITVGVTMCTYIKVEQRKVMCGLIFAVEAMLIRV